MSLLAAIDVPDVIAQQRFVLEAERLSTNKRYRCLLTSPFILHPHVFSIPARADASRDFSCDQARPGRADALSAHNNL